MKTFKRPLWTAVLLAAIVCLGVAGTKISRLTQTRTFQPNSLFLVVTGSAANGTLATRHIEATNLLDGLTNLPNWPTTGQASVTNAIGIVRTNGTAVSSAATSFDIITGSNTLVLATNAGGAVTVQINSTGGGSGSALVTNGNQFGASTTLTIKSGARLTNAVLWGTTSSETLYVTNGIITTGPVVGSGGGTLSGTWTLNGGIDGTSTNFIASLAEDTGPLATDYTWTEDRSGAQLVKVQLGAIYFSAANWLTNWANAVSNYVDTASSNRVRLVGGTGGITVSQSGSAGVQTWTINDDDAGGGTTTNFNTIGVGSISAGTVVASNVVRAGRVDVLTNLNAGTLTATNWAQISGPQTNSGAIYATSTASIDGVVSLGSDLNVPSGTIGGSAVTVSSSLSNNGQMVENIDKTGTSVSVAVGAGPHYSIQTNTAPTFTFSGTPVHGQRISITVSNTSTAQFTVGFPTAYSMQVRSNVTGWACAASNYVILPFIRTTNEVGGGIWLLDKVSELEATLAVASAGANGFLALSTNAGGDTITISNAYLPQASSLQLSNAAASALTFATSGQVSNTTAIKFAVQQPAITTSNLVVSFSTNRYEVVGATNLVLTNIVEEATGVSADASILVRATTGNIALVWPSYGAQHGYYFRTNINNPILSWAAVTNGKTAVISFTAWGTNVVGTIVELP